MAVVAKPRKPCVGLCYLAKLGKIKVLEEEPEEAEEDYEAEEEEDYEGSAEDDYEGSVEEDYEEDYEEDE